MTDPAVGRLASKAPGAVIRAYRLKADRAEMRSILQGALRRALCPYDQNATAVRSLAEKLEERLWEPAATAPPAGKEEGRGATLARAWRRFWRLPEIDLIDHVSWRAKAAAWVEGAAAPDELTAMRRVAVCVEAPRDPTTLGKRFPEALDDEVNDRAGSRLALELARRLYDADQRDAYRRRGRVKRTAAIAGSAAGGFVAGKLGADIAHLQDSVDAIATVLSGLTTGAVAKGRHGPRRPAPPSARARSPVGRGLSGRVRG